MDRTTVYRQREIAQNKLSNRAERSKRIGINDDRVLRELERIAFIDPTKVLDLQTNEVLKEHRAIKVTTDGGVDKLQADLNINAIMDFLDKQRRDVDDFAAAGGASATMPGTLRVPRVLLLTQKVSPLQKRRRYFL